MFISNKLKIEIENRIAYLTINRPEFLNALDYDLLNDLKCVFENLSNIEDVLVVIITGEGRAFISGADIEQMKNLSAIEARKFSSFGQCVMNLIENFEKPVIAAINGYALGGGCELCMAADIRIASVKARFGQPELSLGIIPGFGGTQRLSRLVGKGMAKYLTYTGDMIDANEALKIGLVQKVVEPEKLIEECEILANKIISKAPIAIKYLKQAIDKGIELDLSSGCDYESDLFASCFKTNDHKEGILAFLEKRTAKFTNS